MGSSIHLAHTVPKLKKKRTTELPHSLAALKTPFTSLLCDIPKHNEDYLKSESSLKIKTTQRGNRKRVEEGDRVLPLLAPGRRQAKQHTQPLAPRHTSPQCSQGKHGIIFLFLLPMTAGSRRGGGRPC